MKKLKNKRSEINTLWPKCLSGIFLIFLIACSQSKEKADLIVHNAVIYTVDSTFSNAQSFAIKDGKFIAVGSNEEISQKYEAKENIDAEGKAVYPGFIDSHCHFYHYGKGLYEINLVATKSFSEVITRIKEFKNDPNNKWIIGRGWDQNDWTKKEYPDLKSLDSLFPDKPVFLERIDGHAALVNTAGLREAGITPETKISGGVIEMKNGKLTGILVDNAVDLVKNVIPKATKEAIKKYLLTAQENCFSVGLTTVDDAGLDKNIINAIDDLQKSDDLKMRLYAMLSDNKENKDYYFKNSVYVTPRLTVRSFKFYGDGALGSRGACLLQPYSDKPETSGFFLHAKAHYDSAAINMADKNFQMNTHCIGDSAVRFFLKLYSATMKECKISDSTSKTNFKNIRWRLEHFQICSPEDLKLLEEMSKNGNLIASVQPTHASSDMYWAEERIGKERMKNAYAYNDILKASGRIALGTDFPVENINPMYTFYAATARKDLKGFPEGGFQIENALSRENTLRGMTIWGAYANYEDDKKGSIEKGKYADFVILDKDIMKCELDSVPKVRVISTYVNGELVYHGGTENTK
ncbi:MAG: amidohydrolase [Bacteroidota bacterium]|jgi:predicted amidohydrolase YtcJ|nr:amidohydrolase [Bacteroidota bacterium]